MSGSTNPTGSAIVICGLGRFGTATANTLAGMGREVLAIDEDPKLVDKASDLGFRAIQGDCTNPVLLRELGVDEFGQAVVAIGSSIEASVLTCVTLIDMGLRDIWAKAISHDHARILKRIGVEHVVMPEAEAGQRAAHLVTNKLIDFIEFDDGYAIVKMLPPKETQGFTLEESNVRSMYGVTIVGVKSPGNDFVHAVPDTRISAHDTLIVSGKTSLIAKFAARP